ncbi:MAG TPA: aldo/keto reductase, partial [Anaerolineales bacterium]|nr:aldo/keto reductase [Anaerolineales bacterium]
GGGHTEELVGQVIRDFDRSKLFIASKVWHTNLHSGEVIQACARSLERLGTDYLDLYLIHWPDDDTPLEETFHGLNDLLEQGAVRRLGVSNFSLQQLQHAEQLAARPLATNQVPYSLTNREYVENGVVDYCKQNGILVTAYTPVEKGKLANHPELQSIARAHGATPIQVALAWLVQQENVITIPQSTNLEHLRLNLEAADLDLSAEEMERLNGVVETV